MKGESLVSGTRKAVQVGINDRCRSPGSQQWGQSRGQAGPGNQKVAALHVTVPATVHLAGSSFANRFFAAWRAVFSTLSIVTGLPPCRLLSSAASMKA